MGRGPRLIVIASRRSGNQAEPAGPDDGRGAVTLVRRAVWVVPRGITAARGGVTVVRSGVTVVRSAVTVVRSAVIVARSAVAVVRSAVTVVRSAVMLVRSAVMLVSSAVTVVRSAVVVVRSAVTVVRSGVTVERRPVGSLGAWAVVYDAVVLTRIFADNFRALVNFELRPGRLSLLLGDNGSGKSTVLEALGSVRDLVVLGRSTVDLFTNMRTKWETRDVQRFELDLEKSGGTYRYALEIQHPKGSHEKPSIRSENVSFDGQPLYRFSDGEVRLDYDDGSTSSVFPFRADQSFLTNLEAGRTNRLGRLAGFKELIAGIWNIQPNPFAMVEESKQDVSFLARNGVNFAAFFDYLNDERPDVRTLLEEHLQHAIPGFRNFRFQRVGDAKVLLAALGDEQHKGEVTLRELSEGQRVLAILYAAVLGHMRTNSLLCFDEPDNFVSLPEIQPWLQVLRDVLEEHGGQTIIISHHPEVIDYLALDSIWRFERPSGPVIARPWDPTEAPDLKLSELIVRGA